MELWRRVFPGSKEAKRRIILKDRFLRSEQISAVMLYVMNSFINMKRCSSNNTTEI